MSEYRSGYGQAKADVLQCIAEAQTVIEANPIRFGPEEALMQWKARREALRWVRAMVKPLKSPK